MRGSQVAGSDRGEAAPQAHGEPGNLTAGTRSSPAHAGGQRKPPGLWRTAAVPVRAAEAVARSLGVPWRVVRWLLARPLPQYVYGG
ncbi:MAG: hypothetical protein K6T30_10000 [Alicyclobacillus sp.]|nr:hypothetical protein [Alicyclobacillus sp.]